jgi:hypothetical protein
MDTPCKQILDLCNFDKCMYTHFKHKNNAKELENEFNITLRIQVLQSNFTLGTFYIHMLYLESIEI